MKHQLFNRLCATAALLAGMTSVAPVLAATTGTQYIGGPNAMDVFRITCPANSVGLSADVLDGFSMSNPAAAMVTILKDGLVSSSDQAEGSPAGPRVTLDSGSGQYYVVFRQHGFYTSNIHCRKSLDGFSDPAGGRVVRKNPEPVGRSSMHRVRTTRVIAGIAK